MLKYKAKVEGFEEGGAGGHNGAAPSYLLLHCPSVTAGPAGPQGQGPAPSCSKASRHQGAGPWPRGPAGPACTLLRGCSTLPPSVACRLLQTGSRPPHLLAPPPLRPRWGGVRPLSPDTRPAPPLLATPAACVCCQLHHQQQSPRHPLWHRGAGRHRRRLLLRRAVPTTQLHSLLLWARIVSLLSVVTNASPGHCATCVSAATAS
jgi:hypothetical protein